MQIDIEIYRAEHDAQIRSEEREAAAARVIAACGCGTEGGCEGEADGWEYEYGSSGAGCERFVRAVIGEEPS